jgi:hypothetical protein
MSPRRRETLGEKPASSRKLVLEDESAAHQLVGSVKDYQG